MKFIATKLAAKLSMKCQLRCSDYAKEDEYAVEYD